MSTLELPHSAECLVCGRNNPRGLRLTFHVDPDDGFVRTRFAPDSTMCGFAGIVHGGLLATVFDEAMVWAASWSGKKFCVCGELNIRFVKPARVDQPVLVAARIEAARSRLIAAVASMTDEAGELIASASAKYLPMAAELNQQMLGTMLREQPTEAALAQFTKDAHAR